MSLAFYLVVLSVPGSTQETTLHLVGLSWLVGLLLLVTVSQIFLLYFFLMILAVLRTTGLVIYRTTLNWDLSDVFLLVRQWLWVLEKTTEVKCHSHHIMPQAHTITKIYDLMLILGTKLESC